MFKLVALQGGNEYRTRVGQITQPTLFLHGTDDLIWHFKYADVLPERIKDSKLISLDGTHKLQVEGWDFFCGKFKTYSWLPL